MTFDFKTAWNELARPEFEALDTRAKYLFLEVAEKCAESEQGKDLLIPWPDVEMRQHFEALPRPILAYASRVIYFYGHWSPEGHASIGAGAYWKFADLADQSLRASLPVAPTLARPESSEKAAEGVSLRVCNGFLRVCVSTRDTWQWRELGLATIANQAAWGSVELPVIATGLMPTQMREHYARALPAYLARCFETVAGKASPEVLRWLTVAQTYKA